MPGCREGLRIAAAVALFAAAAIGAEPPSLRRGEVIESVPAAGYPGESYALYLPSTYSPQKKWPIVYAFDPGAHGRYPVRLYKDVAEKYGFILAGSNNSVNFNPQAAAEGAEAMIRDTAERLAIDRDRIYTTGFSGGARVATWVALQCAPCKIKGVLAGGATYPSDISAAAKDGFLYFIAFGDTDFNYPEFVRMEEAKERLGSAYRVRMFPGPHHWSPPEVFDEALAWFQLRAMQSDSVPGDPVFIQQQWDRETAEAADAGRAHDVLREYYARKSLAEDFRGLHDYAQAKARLRAIAGSRELKKAREQQHKNVEAQQALAADAARDIDQFAAAPLSKDPERNPRESIIARMQKLKHDGDTIKNENDRRISARAFYELYAQVMETGQMRQVKKQYAEALAFFQIAAQAAPDLAWPPMLMAETEIAMGDRKRALKSLRQAASTGRVRASDLEKDAALAPLFSDPEFQKVLAELKARAGGG